MRYGIVIKNVTISSDFNTYDFHIGQTLPLQREYIVEENNNKICKYFFIQIPGDPGVIILEEDYILPDYQANNFQYRLSRGIK